MKLDPLARSFGMSDAVWARHANPLSVWTRLPILPLLALAIWARVWIGWGCLVPILALCAWAWINPRAFPVPASTDSWASKAVMGERVWLAHPDPEVPDHHLGAARLLSTLSGLGLPPLIWGLYVLDVWAVIAGLALTLTGKLWFLDRMVWIFEDLAAKHSVYRDWLRGTCRDAVWRTYQTDVETLSNPDGPDRGSGHVPAFGLAAEASARSPVE